ncbi:hypothetical protein RHMOL_Rhmol03G0183700 [Rhododendron molle]|uniref:Uncharacterized protein n=1 Tax=Rhododendron molle TaxID=49168 RepID=A0ACC0PFW1_RHOML|nr:hypothetical protein RHMOL_Rhmol03G0183700 [Rhododendron molle]
MCVLHVIDHAFIHDSECSSCFLFTIPNFHVCFCNGINSSSSNHTHSNITCFENERDALLKFKQDLKDASNRLSSWVIGEDCCKWTGVVCDNFTGHVREIRLRNPYEFSNENYTELEAYMRYQLGAKINPSLLDLKHLQYLDLSKNDFEGTPIPSFIGSIATLRYLNLSMAGFGGTIPPQLGNITTMRYLDLRSNYDLLSGNLQWLSHLVLLQHLDMSGVDLSKALDWLQVTSNLPSLVELHLSTCELKNLLHGAVSIAIENLTSLVSLDLSNNQLHGSIPTSLGKLCKLKTISLSHNEFSGEVADIFVGFSQCKSNELETFRSWGNHLLGHLPYELGQLTSLADFDLHSNSFSGPIPASIGRLSSLIRLDLSHNEFNGTLPESLGHLGKLEVLYISDNSLGVSSLMFTLPVSRNYVT